MIGLSIGLPVHLGEHRVGLGLGEKAAALDRRQLRRVAEHQHRHAERQQVAAELGVDHRAFVDDDQLGLGGGRLVPQIEGGDFLAALARPVDQRMDGGGALAAFAAHHRGRLAGEGGELHLAVGVLGEVAGERGLAGAGIAEQAEHLWRAVGARLGLEPLGDGFERIVLVRGELRHGGSNRPYGLNEKEQNMNLDGRRCVDYIPSASPVNTGAVMTRPDRPARAAPDNGVAVKPAPNARV